MERSRGRCFRGTFRESVLFGAVPERVVPVMGLLPVLALVAGAMLVFLVAEAADAAPNEEIGRVYFEQAERLFRAGSFDDAMALVEVAREFQPDASDLHHLRGLILRREQSATMEAISAFRNALEHANYRTYSPRESRLRLARILLRTDQPDAALEVVNAARGTPRSEPELLYVTARALYESGSVSEAWEEAERGLRLYPDDARFIELLITMNRPAGLREAELLREHRADDPAYREAVLAFLRHAVDPVVILEWERRYRQAGGEDPLATVIAMEAHAETAQISLDAHAAVEQFRKDGGMRDRRLVMRLIRALEAIAERENGTASEQATRIREELDNYSGQLVTDRDRNGFYEELYRYEDGELNVWRIDRDQNGQQEYRIELADGVRQAVISEERTVIFGRYPAVRSVSFDDTEYSLLPGRLRFPLLAPGTSWHTGPIGVLDEIDLNPTLPLLSRELVRKHAYLRTTGGERPATIERLLGGEVVRRAEDRNRDGTIDYIVELSDGSPTIAVRDPDYDGVFEATEQFREGVISGLSVDTDDDGRVDYVERYGEEVVLSWDLDEDGDFELRAIRTSRRSLLGSVPIDRQLTVDALVQAWKREPETVQ